MTHTPEAHGCRQQCRLALLQLLDEKRLHLKQVLQLCVGILFGALQLRQFLQHLLRHPASDHRGTGLAALTAAPGPPQRLGQQPYLDLGGLLGLLLLGGLAALLAIVASQINGFPLANVPG